MADDQDLAHKTADLLGAAAQSLAEQLMTAASLPASHRDAAPASAAAGRQADQLALILKTRALLLSHEVRLD